MGRAVSVERAYGSAVDGAWEPGDRIVVERPHGKRREYVVVDPPTKTVLASWWRTWLPPHHRREPKRVSVP
jgi:hypothetical protein